MLLYKVILKSIWTYKIQLWGMASGSSINVLQRFQLKTLRTITKMPWYVNNISTVLQEITRYSEKYLVKLDEHSNHLPVSLLDNIVETRRLKRHTPLKVCVVFCALV